MSIEIRIHVSEKLYLKNPDTSEVGQKIIQKGAHLMLQLGYEEFTFKKLAAEIHTTEVTIYRYFENKHRLLLYLLSWYWGYIDYLIAFDLPHYKTIQEKIKRLVYIMVHTTELPELSASSLNIQTLQQLVINESNKSYLTKEVDGLNNDRLFKPYKTLCGHIADIFLEYNPQYKYSHSLASTFVETTIHQLYFAQHLPALTDFKGQGRAEMLPSMVDFIECLLFNTLTLLPIV